MDEPFLDHPRAFTAAVGRVLGGRAVEHPRLSGFLNSRFDRFLNQLFASEDVAPDDAVEALDGRPGFVWLAGEPAPAVMWGMTATTAVPLAAPSVVAKIAEVRSAADVAAWHEVYCEVFGGDASGRGEWQRIHGALGPTGEGSLELFVARVEGSPAATGGVYFHDGWAGLYCFTTRRHMRGRGLASALVHSSHEAARARGIDRALLHTTPLGRSVYARAGYRDVRPLPLLVAPA